MSSVTLSYQEKYLREPNPHQPTNGQINGEEFVWMNIYLEVDTQSTQLQIHNAVKSSQNHPQDQT